MEGMLHLEQSALISNKSYQYLPATTARLTSAAAHIAIGPKFQVTSGDVTSSLMQAMSWATVAKQILLSYQNSSMLWRAYGTFNSQATKKKHAQDAKPLTLADLEILDIWYREC